MSETDETKQVYSTPCYQLTRQIVMFIMMIATLLMSLLIESFQSLMNDKINDMVKNINCSKT